MYLLVQLLYDLVCAWNPVVSTQQDLEPIILVPGILSSRLEYAFDGYNHWEPLWLDIKSMLPPHLKHWAKLFELEYDMKNGLYSTKSGLIVRTVDYGGIDVSSLYSLVRQLSFALSGNITSRSPV